MTTNKQQRVFKPLALASAIALAAAPAIAQSPAKSSDSSLEEVVVTARFREESAQDIGASILALSEAQLREQGVDSVSDLASMVPSLDLQDRGPNRNEISIRGVGRSLFQQDLSLSMANIGLYLDDVPLNLPVGAQLDVPSFDLQRVEVLRGPQGTLFGEGAQGGALRYFTRDPDLASFGGTVEGYANTTEDGDDGFGGRIALNVPVVKDQLGLRLVANRTDLGGFVDNSAGSGEDSNGFQSDNLRAVLLWQPSDAFRARLLVAHQESDQDTLNYVSDEDDPEFAVFSTADNSVEDEYDIYSANLRYDFGPVSIESITSQFERDRDRYVFEPVFTGQFGLIGGALGFPTVRDYYNIDTTSYEQFSQEIRFVSHLDGPFNFVAGAFYRDFDLEMTSDGESQKLVELAPVYASMFGAAPPADPSPVASVLAEQLGLTTIFNAPGIGAVTNEGEQISGFAEFTYEFTEQWSLIAGIRRHDEEIDAASIASAAEFFTTFAPPVDFEDSTEVQEWLPKVALEYRPIEDMLLYASYTEGVRNGNLNASSSVAAVAQANPDRAEEVQVFGPEFVKAYELGLKGTACDTRMSYAIALFHNDIDDLQAYGTAIINNSVAGVVENIGDGYSEGMEAEFRFQVNDNLSLFAGGNYVEAEIDELKTGLATVVTTVEGQRIPFIPEYTVTAGANAQMPLGDTGWELFGTLNYQYTGDYATFFQAPEGSAQNPVLGEYGIANLGVGARNDRYSVELRAANLFDEREVMSVSPIQDLFLSYGLQLPPGANIDDWQMTRPRTLTLTLRADF